MKFLSSRRRHPLAGFVVLVLGLLVMGGLYSMFRPAQAEQGANDKQLVAQGRELYVVSCSTCHGMNAEGVVTKTGDNYGPPLVGVGAAAVDFQVGTGRMPMADPGPGQAQRVPLMTPDETRALAAYIASLGPGPAIPSPGEYDAAHGDPAKGGLFFRTNCTACHNFAGSGGALPHGRQAPDLMKTPPKYIFEAMETGPGQMPKFSNGVMTPQDKRDIISYIQHLKTTPGYGGLKLGSLGPVSEGLWGWLIGIGGLILIAVWIGNHGVRAGKKSK
ncbi:MAG TPA: cytochrome c [Nocardioidaceae bacterium]|nr:cytochrome c [Nocardioidaceae bacterium]